MKYSSSEQIHGLCCIMNFISNIHILCMAENRCWTLRFCLQTRFSPFILCQLEKAIPWAHPENWGAMVQAWDSLLTINSSFHPSPQEALLWQSLLCPRAFIKSLKYTEMSLVSNCQLIQTIELNKVYFIKCYTRNALKMTYLNRVIICCWL